jgi:hypothetical protein
MTVADRYLGEIFGDADLSDMRAMLLGEGGEVSDNEETPLGDDRPATNERPRDERGCSVRAQESDQAEDAGDQADGEQDDEGERTPAAGYGEPLSAADSRRPRRLTPARRR